MKCRIGRLQYVRPPDSAYMRGRKYIRNRGYGGSVRTSAQAAVKSIFKQLSQLLDCGFAVDVTPALDVVVEVCMCAGNARVCLG